MSSLFENYEKMLVHFLTASNITVCDGDLCHRMIEDLPPVERDHTVVGDNYQKVVLGDEVRQWFTFHDRRVGG